jgi:PAS domain-containing protein
MSNRTPGSEDLRQYKVMFDNTWNLSTVLATATVVVSWYFGLVQLDIGPVIWTLTGLALIQFALHSQSSRAGTSGNVRLLAFSSQLLGTALMGVGWHLFGGLKQPLFPLFIVLPLLPGSLVLRFWQQQASILAMVGLLVTGVLLSPDSNSFIDERYGITIVSANALPAWIPRSRTVFSDVTTSPAYDLLLVTTVVLIAIAVSSTASALARVCARAADRVRSVEGELARLQQLTTQIVTHAPSAEVLVISQSGRIVNASERFLRAFDLPEAAGNFLLDAIEFAYPSVIKRLMAEGGDEIQGARLRGSNVVLRVRAEVMGSGDFAALNIEPCDDICWRGEVDALDEPVFAINAEGDVVYLNRPALTVFGERAEGVAATELFESGATRWWDIAPLDSARRTLDRGKRRYLASIRRKRIAESIGELSFIHLHEIGPFDAAAAS